MVKRRYFGIAMDHRLYRLTKTGLEWYRKNRVLNRKRTSSQKYSRCIWEVILGRLCLGASDAKTLIQTFVVDGFSPWYEESEVLEQLELLRKMAYLTTMQAPEMDAIAAERAVREGRIVKECGRDWKLRNERLRVSETETMNKLDDWFKLHPDWPE